MAKLLTAYLASPYTHPDENVRLHRFEAAKFAAAKILKENIAVFSPIAYSHPIAVSYELPTDWNFWQDQDESMIAALDIFMVLPLEGWQQSVGVQAELEIAKNLSKHVVYLSDDYVLKV